MYSVVYAPFALSVAVVVLSRLGVKRLPPRAATWAITIASAALSLSTAGALALLACWLPARLPIVAAVGGWRPESVASLSPTPTWTAAVALAALVWLGWRVVRESGRLRSEFAVVVAAHAELARFAGGVVVVEDAVPSAHAVARTLRRRGRVVVTTGMLDLLDDEERAAVVAHEHSHLRHGHGAFVAAVQLSSALNPLIAPMRQDLHFTLERWADEEAAEVTHRAVVASALAKVAIAIMDITEGEVPPPALLMSLHTYAISDRVTALLDNPKPRPRLV